MTENDAKTKWCPFARAPLATALGEVLSGASVVNRRTTGAPDAASVCLASACMAWRQAPELDLSEAKAEATAGRKISAIKALRAVVPSLNLKEAKDIVEDISPWPQGTPNGFCGLAGAPS